MGFKSKFMNEFDIAHTQSICLLRIKFLSLVLESVRTIPSRDSQYSSSGNTYSHSESLDELGILVFQYHPSRNFMSFKGRFWWKTGKKM